ncbi:hypothetical protein DVU_0977 [Nitratidesulfovibrio vulgaris str. Hildenborough]|uniref:Uncharacterized protein n=1 Tax=Nitratidesulfovibrio vulgaris (strain ATCC 29579 / DSM 644 / CCUG 34227 / NCIMB 8303 / VKM B-1760 / Hildenborough) TaxID=882 RepID=Q72DF2_NITV2|nr:hypothetical protein DVU_0977 [Nitratidesulfovibrio vulgaris str. Hildenborough]
MNPVFEGIHASYDRNADLFSEGYDLGESWCRKSRCRYGMLYIPFVMCTA